MGGRSAAAVLRAFWMRTWSMTTSAAIASTMGTARGTTHGSWRPRAASVPGVPSYCAVSCACEIVAGDLKPILPPRSHQPPIAAQTEPRTEQDTPEVDILAIRDPTLNPTAPVCLRTHAPVWLRDERVVVLAPGDLRPTEAGADLEGLRRGNGEHRVRELRLELVKHGLAQPGGHAAHYAGDRAADRVARVLCAQDALYSQDQLQRMGTGRGLYAP